MKRITKILALTLAMAMVLCLAACGGSGSGDSYTDYSNAYKKTAGPGSLNVEFGLMVTANEQEMQSNGNMKMDSNNNVYYEMTINEKQILQYVTNGEVHTIVDGQEQVSSIDDKDSSTKRANPDGEVGDESAVANEKVDESGFNIDRFMEEFSGLMEAGKIKEMGVLDPIPSRYIKEITKEEDGNDIVYNITFPEEFLEKLLDTMIEEQTADTGGITFDNLRDFSCVSKENVDGYLYYIQYKGYTTVNVPGEYMTDGEDEVFDLGIDLAMTIKDPGTAVTVEIPD